MTLQVAVGANLSEFQRGMDRVGQLADSTVADVERRFSESNPSIVPAIDKMTSEARQAASSAGMLLGGLLGGGIATAVLGVIDFIGKLNDQMRDLEKNAKQAGLTIEEFQRIRFAANTTGINDSDFASGIGKLAERLNDARRNENDLSKLLDANNIKYKDRNNIAIDTNKALDIARDLIQRANGEQDKNTVAKMLGVTKEWVELLDRSAAEFENLKRRGDELGVVIDEATVKKAAQFSREWTQATAEWSAFFRAQLAGLLPAADEFLKRLSSVPEGAAQATKQLAEAPRQEVDKMTTSFTNLVAAIMTGKDASEVLDLLLDAFKKFGTGEVIAPLENATRRINDAFSALPTEKSASGNITGAAFGRRGPVGPETVIPPKTDPEKTAFERETERLQRHTAAMLADAAAVGLTTGKHEELRAQLLLLNAAEKDGEDITQEQIAAFAKLRAEGTSTESALSQLGITLDQKIVQSLKKVPVAAGEAAQSVFNAKQQFQGMNDSLRFAGNTLVDVIDRATQKGANFGEIMKDVLRSITRELLRAAITGEGAFAKMLGLASNVPGGVGGLFGNLGGLFSSATSTIGAFAEGGEIPAGGLGLVGEHGPNPRLIRAGAEPIMVTPNEIKGAGGGNSVTVSPTYHIDASGADVKTVERLQAALFAVNQSLEGRVRSTVTEDSRRRMRR